MYIYDTFANELVEEKSVCAPPERYIELTEERAIEVVDDIRTQLNRYPTYASALAVVLSILKN